MYACKIFTFVEIMPENRIFEPSSNFQCPPDAKIYMNRALCFFGAAQFLVELTLRSAVTSLA